MKHLEDMKILIVDDSTHVHNQLKIFLSSAGIDNLLFAESAKEAFALLGLDAPAQPNTEIDLILMDIEMEEINGIEAIVRIKDVAEFADIPILMITGDTSPTSLQASFQAGAVDYITKPFNKVELIARIRSFLKLKAETDARKKREQEKEVLIAELKDALVNIKTLKQMLPICSSCKKIRDDTGYWQQIESYIRDHTDTDFSHGICPECAEKLYPELDLFRKKSSETDTD